VTLPDQFCRAFEDVAKEAIVWLLYAEGERTLNISVTATLLHSGLVNVLLRDLSLLKFLAPFSKGSDLQPAAQDRYFSCPP